MMNNERKLSEDVYYDSEEEGTDLFPRHAEANIKASLETLAENYNPASHSQQLANCCFRCHHPQIARAYMEFRDKVHPDLSPPRISTLYTNDQFVDLSMLSRDQQLLIITIPAPFIEPVPKSLGHLLDELFERNGYIPNLERFLLYYPTYL